MHTNDGEICSAWKVRRTHLYHTECRSPRTFACHYASPFVHRNRTGATLPKAKYIMGKTRARAGLARSIAWASHPSRTRMPRIRSPRTSNRVPRSRSDVGRRPGQSGENNRRRLAVPAMMRMSGLPHTGQSEASCPGVVEVRQDRFGDTALTQDGFGLLPRCFLYRAPLLCCSPVLPSSAVLSSSSAILC